jgi:signal peptidase
MAGLKLDMEGWFGSLLYAVGGVVIAVAIYYLLGLLLGTGLPVVAVVSNSMSPTFNRGDLVVVQGAQPQDLKVGDVIVFSVKTRGAPIIHRIIEVKNSTFQTLGDNNNPTKEKCVNYRCSNPIDGCSCNNYCGQLPEECTIYPEQIQGRMLFSIPLLGWVKVIAVDYVFPRPELAAIILIGIAVIYLMWVK